MKEPNLNVEKVGARIRKFRTNLHLSQSAFAKMASISPSFLSLIEKGERKPPLELLMQVAFLTGTSMDYLLYGESNIRVNENHATLRRLENRYPEEEIKDALKIMEYSLKLQHKQKDTGD